MSAPSAMDNEGETRATNQSILYCRDKEKPTGLIHNRRVFSSFYVFTRTLSL